MPASEHPHPAAGSFTTLLVQQGAAPTAQAAQVATLQALADPGLTAGAASGQSGHRMSPPHPSLAIRPQR
jgi:hypothetical protein